MMAATHLAFAAAVATADSVIHGHPLHLTTLAGAAFGSLLPDIDHPKSWIGRRAWFLSRPIAAIFGHRGITHSLIAAAASLAVSGLPLDAWHSNAIALGYLSHLAADLLTPAGVPLLWPHRHAFRFPVVRTGSLTEYGLLVVFVVFTLVYGERVGR